MKKQIFTVLLAFAFGLGLMLLAAKPSMAVHAGSGALSCGGCHTMHNSENDADMGGAAGGTIRLLRATGEVSNLCLQCHEKGGSLDASYAAPWVSTDAATISSDPTVVGGGGDFYWELAGVRTAASYATGNGTGYGHSILGATLLPPGRDTAATSDTLNCTNCHDPHGTTYDQTTSAANGFRNLKPTVSGNFKGGVSVSFGALNSTTGAEAFYRGVSALISDRWPAVNAGATASNKYSSDISGWCAQCHDAWHEGSTDGATNDDGTTTAGQDWRRHPVNNVIYDTGNEISSNGNTITDLANYVNTAIVAAKDRLPIANVAGDTGAATTAYYVNASEANGGAGKVFCLSCHFAHAGPNPNGLRWSHAALGDSTAVAVGLASNVGCQQCHMRGYSNR